MDASSTQQKCTSFFIEHAPLTHLEPSILYAKLIYHICTGLYLQANVSMHQEVKEEVGGWPTQKFTKIFWIWKWCKVCKDNDMLKANELTIWEPIL